MESKQNNEPGPKVPVIFRPLSCNQLHDILEHNGATKNETKSVFLIRDNSGGFITVSYYSLEHEMVKNLRFGLTSDGWKTVPKPPKEPSFTDTLEVKTKYIIEKAKFDEEMQSFINTAKVLFEQNVRPEQIKALSYELQKNEFNMHGLIRPNREQASKERHYIDYVKDAFLIENPLNLAIK
ncbi:hypothetical protein DGG96_07865 [Legionella qingyii]|uniref:SH2 domain-containing protein n=1 Tax=Legionella qingyii TaxID=2184757 RepID=A0A317U2I2_9GAMM|nr:hypothetical protein [Legionella qingyii]PWY56244.1 hypothetical protein DGG96_07865 [Legionella qingyii]RUR22275.1 hypothetical protein ELY20_10240 [Legionella qingyii]RUR25735.1 hypothetical protein ELY16_08760 [Legionella qingyii]